jgi:hypothetical protein
MPAAKPTAKRTREKASVKAHVARSKPHAKAERPMLNGIPLRQRTVWSIDTDSAQFRAARRRDAQALLEHADDRDSMQFLDAVLTEKDMGKWWK